MISLCTTILLMASPIAAQSVGGASEMLNQWGGETLSDNFGISVASAGDVNADGFDDVIVGAPRYVNGKAYVYSGADGTLLYQWPGGANYDSFGQAVAGAGDVNADGFDDVIVGAYKSSAGGFNSAGSAYIYSGADGALLLRLDGDADFDGFGRSVAGAGDINADGFDDVLIGAPFADPAGATSAGSVYAVSGINGTVLYHWSGTAAADIFGNAIAAAGDVNADGFDDIIVGAPFVDISTRIDDVGAAMVYSGADGTMLYQWNGDEREINLGASVAGAGDVNQDGYADVIVGIPFATAPGNFYDAGAARVYSGADGSLLYQFFGFTWNDHFGTSVSSAGDIDGDSYADLIIGAPNANPEGRIDAGSAFLYSGATGVLLHQWNGIAANDSFGQSVAYANDTDADGMSDILIGAPRATPGHLPAAGSAQVFNFKPFLHVSTYSISVATGATLRLRLDFPDVAGLDRYKVLISALGTGPTNFGIDIPLSIDTMAWNSYFGNYPFPVSSNLHGTLNASGDASASITLPAGLNPALIGNTYYFAAIANQFGQLPEYSSIAIPLNIIP